MSCAHCKGSGFCKYTSVVYDKRKRIVYRHCNACGAGTPRRYSYIINPVPDALECSRLKLPVCSACGGRGY